MAKGTDFIDRPTPWLVLTSKVASQSTRGPHLISDTLDLNQPWSRPIYEVSSLSDGKRYPNDLSDADNMLGHKNYATCKRKEQATKLLPLALPNNYNTLTCEQNNFDNRCVICDNTQITIAPSVDKG